MVIFPTDYEDHFGSFELSKSFYIAATVNSQSFPAAPNLDKNLPKNMGAREVISPLP